MTLSEIALKHGKSVVLVVNKWDLFEKNQSTLPEYEAYLRTVFRYMKWVPIIFTSAKEKLRTFRLLEIIQNIHAARNIELKTSKLNKIIQLLILKRPPQARNRKIKHPKIYYATQTGMTPPEFTLFVNDPKFFHNSYTRYLKNQLREHFDFYGTPIKISYRERR
jgi:GTP-binding protein